MKNFLHKIKIRYYLMRWKLSIYWMSIYKFLADYDAISIEDRKMASNLTKKHHHEADEWFRKALTCDMSDGAAEFLNKAYDRVIRDRGR